ncbi:DUF2817 domain-containing protein [Candidatus Sumerlaeota bacterium]|nr:DUF2817 domain-containing protein [Candidatus Sumerlaeota bacterium]
MKGTRHVRLATHMIHLMATLMLFTGCGAKGPEYLRRDPLRARAEEVGRSVEGRPLRVLTLGSGPEVILVLATIHGNENAGTPLTLALIDFLDRNPDLLSNRTVVMMPVVNPDGYYHDRRFNMNRVDLNRNFPASNRDEWRRSSGPQPLSEPESVAVKQVLDRFKPARIVSMHEPLSTIDWDGPGEDIARHMGNYVNLPVNQIGSRPGSLGSYAGVEQNIPIITLEFPRGAGRRAPEDLWRDYGRVLVSFITYPNEPPAVLRGEDILRKEKPTRPPPGDSRRRDEDGTRAFREG